MSDTTVTPEATDLPAGTETDHAMPTPADLDRPLGPQGEKALHAEKEKRRAESAKRREIEAELADLRAKMAAPKDAEAPDTDAMRREIEKELAAKYAERTKLAEVKAAAAGKFADPADALRFLDLSQVEVDKDGNVDAADLGELLDGLLSAKPYLGVTAQRGPNGSPDNGVRKEHRPDQLSLAQTESMTSDDIEKARLSGRLNDVLGIK